MIGSWLARVRTQGKSVFTSRRRRQAAIDDARTLYTRAVAQSRHPRFYADYAVPDTHDGRLELIQLHVILLLRRLQRGDEAAQAIGQALFDVLFTDVDRSLRESGVGDLSVGKWVKKIARQFYARAAAVEGALEVRDDAVLQEVLHANVYGGTSVGDAPKRLADYLLAADTQLAALAALQPDPMQALHFRALEAMRSGSEPAETVPAAS